MSHYNPNAKPFAPKPLAPTWEPPVAHMQQWGPPAPTWGPPGVPSWGPHDVPMHNREWAPMPAPMPAPMSAPMPALLGSAPKQSLRRDADVQTDSVPLRRDAEIQTDPEFGSKKTCICECIHSEKYLIPKGYKKDEAALWDQLRPQIKQKRITHTLCVGEPEGLSGIRSRMITDTFKLAKEVLTPNTYCIKSVRTDQTNPDFEDFKVYYRNDHPMPYKTSIRTKHYLRVEEYDLEDNCRTVIRNCISDKKNKSYKQSWNYKKEERKLEVFDNDTLELLHTEVLSGEYWLENSFTYMD